MFNLFCCLQGIQFLMFTNFQSLGWNNTYMRMNVT
jgi:hypothetical protein